MITEVRIRQTSKDMGDYDVDLFEVFSQDGDHLGDQRKLMEAIVFAQGLLGDTNDESFLLEGAQRIVLELDPAILPFGGLKYGRDSEHKAFVEGQTHPRSNKRLVT